MLVETLKAITLAGIPAGVFWTTTRQIRQIAKATDDNKVKITHPSPETKRVPHVTTIMLGWGGAKHRQMRRLNDWYVQNGVTSMMYTAPMIDIVDGYVDTRPLDVMCKEALAEVLHRKSRLYVHVFSNNGVFTYGALLKVLEKPEYGRLKKVLSGVVFDSAPFLNLYMYTSTPLAFPLTAVLLNKPQYFHWLHTPAMMCVLPFMGALRTKPSGSILKTECIETCWNDPPSCPHLYLYSNTDRLIYARFVERYFFKQKELGRPVIKNKFIGSPHVGHFRMFPIPYTNQLARFMKLAGTTPPTDS